jgi:hypothetical protein
MRKVSPSYVYSEFPAVPPVRGIYGNHHDEHSGLNPDRAGWKRTDHRYYIVVGVSHSQVLADTL